MKETLLSTATLFFLVMDPLGNVPLFITALKNVEAKRRQYVIIRELLIALGVMTIFLFFGRQILELLQVSNPALTAAGGVVLILIAIRMVFPSPERPLRENVEDDEPFIVPLAVPYVAGPSLLAIEVVLINQQPDDWGILLLALFAAWLLSSIILFLSGYLDRFLGRKVLLAIERLMGMILVIVAMQMMMEGAMQFFTHQL